MKHLQLRSKGYWLIPLFLLLIQLQAAAQTGTTVTGKVTDKTNTGLPGVTVQEVGTNNRSLTDNNGAFSITVSSPGAMLVFSSVGFEQRQVKLNNQTALSVQLNTAERTLEDVVVVGYGTARKRDITGAVATFNPKGIEEKPIVRVDQALIGQMAGVQVRQQTGMPGQGFSVQVRGSGSISAGGEPLYVIDGFPLDVVSQSSNGGFTGNPLNNLSPSDIESVQVLKDASAAAIYGSRASNGVVIITTKRGQIGKARITANAYGGISKVARKMDVLSADEWIAQATELANYRWVNSVTNGSRTATQTTAERRTILGLAPGAFNYTYMVDDRWSQPGHPGLTYVDWQDEVFKTANFQNYDINVSGGTEAVRYFFSGNYLNQGGVLANTGFKNYSARGNVEVNASKKLKVGLNLAPSYSETNAPGAEGKDNVLMRMYNFSPIVEDSAGLNTGAGKNNVYGWASSSISPVAVMNNSFSLAKNTRLLLSIYGEYTILNGLSVKTTVNYDDATLNRKNYTSDFVGGNITDYLNQPGRRASGSYSGFKKQNFVSENTINYVKNISENHQINAVAGYSYNFAHIENFTLSTVNGFQNNAVTTLNNALPNASGTSVSGNTTEGNNVLISYYGRLMYSFGDKYLVTASVRRDGSSRFGDNNQWGTFPSLSVGWRISEEAFMRNVHFVNDLKLRAAWGKAGNNSLGDYSSQATLTAANYSFGGSSSASTASSGLSPEKIPNPNLGWEMSDNYNVGIDATILNSRVNIVLDVYERNNNNLLLNVPVVAAAGFTSSLQNIGRVVARGIELGLNTSNISRGDFQWTTSANIAFNRNEVAKLGPGNADINITTNGYGGNPPFLLRVGEPIFSYYLIKTDGILTQKDIDDPNVAKLPKQAAGDTKYVDADDNKVIDARDRVVAGQPNPKFTYGLTNNFKYKNFDLSVQMYGQSGGSIYSFLARAIDNPANGRNTTLGVWRDRWTAANPNPNAPRGKIGIDYTIPYFTTDWLYSSSFFRIQNITLGYNLKKHIKSSFISNARIYASAQNYFNWDRYDGGVNPEAQNVNVSGNSSYPLPGDYGAMPLNKALTVGLNFTF